MDLSEKAENKDKIDINIINNNNKKNIIIYRIIAISLILLICFSINFTDSSEGAMKKIIKENLNIDNTEYATIVSSVSLMGTVFPFINGMFSDKFGTDKAIVIITCILTLSSIINLIASYIKNFRLLILGNVIQGIVDISVEPVQWTILSNLCNSKNLTFIIGLQMAIQRIGKTIGKISANPIYEKTKWFVSIYWVIFSLNLLSVFLSIIYFYYSSYIKKKLNFEKKIKYEKIKFSNIFLFPKLYWFLLVVLYVQAAINVSFLSINTELIQERFNTTTVLAGYISALNTAIPIVLCPLTGIFIDKIGYRAIILLSASYCTLIAWILLMTTNSISADYIAIIFTSLSIPLTIVPVPSMIYILIEDKNLFTTATGLKWCISSAGTSLIQNLAGIIQDNTINKTYVNVIIMYLALSCMASFLSHLFVIIDIKSKYKGLLSFSNKYISDIFFSRSLKNNYIGINFYILAILSAWGIFIYVTIKQ